MKTKQIYKFSAETIFLALIFSLSLIGIHFVITEIFSFTNQDSLIILIPVFLISFPAVIYGYHIGFRRYYGNPMDSPHITINKSTKTTFFEVLNICIYFFLIIIITFIGLYLIIIEKSYALGVVVSLLGAAVSIPISKILYKFLKQENRNRNPT